MLSHYEFPLQAEPNAEANFTITFKKTVRVPNDGEVHPLPPDKGNLDFYVLGDQRIVPVDQLNEAMWFNFDNAVSDTPVAVKILAGDINALTGETETDETYTTLRNNDAEGKGQNYVIVFNHREGQAWLDGFMVPEDEQKLRNEKISVVRQFIAVPLGEGRSIEEKLNGTQRGGVKFIVIPAKPEVVAHIKAERIAEENRQAEEMRIEQENFHKMQAERRNLWIAKLRAEINNLREAEVSETARTEAVALLEKQIKKLEDDGEHHGYTHGNVEIIHSVCAVESLYVDSVDSCDLSVLRSLEHTKVEEQPVKMIKMGLGGGGKIQQEIIASNISVDSFDCANAQYADLDLVTTANFAELTSAVAPTTEQARGIPWFRYITHETAVKADRNSRLAQLETAGNLTALPVELAMHIPEADVIPIYAPGTFGVFGQSAATSAPTVEFTPASSSTCSM